LNCRFSIFTDALLLACIWYFLYACPAQAYFDLNMCSYLLQLSLGLGAAFWFSFKSSLVKTFFKKKTKTKTEDELAEDSIKPSAENETSEDEDS